jgi:hypothetical protein
MTEFEAFEAMMMSTELGVGASMNFVALVFAYLVAAFVVGKSLPKGVAIGTSAIYTIFLVPPLNGVVANFARVYEGDRFIRSTNPDSWLLPADPLSLPLLVSLFVFPMIAGWLGSLYFMHFYIRRLSDPASPKTGADP